MIPRTASGVDSTPLDSSMYLARALELIILRWRPFFITGSDSIVRSTRCLILVIASANVLEVLNLLHL